MAICSGDGNCLLQCECECYDPTTYIYDEICSCGHRDHNGYCPSECCNAIKCRNYKYCNKILPKWVIACHNGMCINCAIQMGKHTVSDIIQECSVCFDSKCMLILYCNHKICNDCWYKITLRWFYYGEQLPLCPLCRNKNCWE